MFTTPMPMHSALISAMMTAARKAPVIEPMPPTTTTTKASPITIRSIARLAGSRATCSAPPRPARNEPQANTSGEQQRLVDAERADHLAVLRGGADQPAEARLGQHQMQQQQHDRPDDDQEQVVAREAAAEDLDRAAQARRARSEQVFGAPDPERRVVDDQHAARRWRAAGTAPAPDRCGAAARSRSARRSPRPAAARARCRPRSRARRRPWSRRCRQVDAQHVERAVGDVDDAGDAEDQRQAGADEEQAGRGGQPVERLEQESVERHHALTASSASPLPQGRRARSAPLERSAQSIELDRLPTLSSLGRTRPSSTRAMAQSTSPS